MRLSGLWWCCLLNLAFGWATLLNAQQNPNGQIPVAGMADAYLILIRDPLVQRELRLTGPQRQSIATVTDELDTTLWTLRNQPAEKAAEGFRTLITTAETRLEPTLSDVQRKRLAQIRLSVAGLQVLLRDDFGSKLKLSSDQRTQIERMLQETNAGEAAPSKANDEPTKGKPKPPSKGTATRIAAILTREQLATAREFLGPAMDVSQMGYVKFKAPELAGMDGWINSEPLTMSQLKGKVVALHFWTFG